METERTTVNAAAPEPPVQKDGQTLKLPVFKLDGTQSGDEVELDPRVFGLPRNDHVLYLAVKVEMANRRQGTHATLTRAMVRGGGKKPWRQKGRGVARAGSTRSPIWRGGGIIFGPQPSDHSLRMPKKAKTLARKTALSVQAQNDAVVLIEDFEMTSPRTKTIADMSRKLGLNRSSVLLLVDGNRPTVVKSCRNIPRVEVRDSAVASTADILRARKVIICRGALRRLVEGLTNEH